MDEDQNQTELTPEEIERQKAMHAGGKVTKLAGEGVGFLAGGPAGAAVGGAVGEGVANSQIGQKAGEKILDHNPNLQKKLAKADDALTAAEPIASTALTSGANAAGGAATGANAAGNAASTGANAASPDAASAAMPGKGFQSYKNGSATPVASPQGPRSSRSQMPTYDTSSEENVSSQETEEEEVEEPADEEVEEGLNEYPMDDPDEEEEKEKKSKGSLIGLILFVGVAPLLFLILCFFEAGVNNTTAMGLYGYPYFEAPCTQVTIINSPNGEYDGTYELEEYIEGVVYAEVGNAGSEEVFKAFAIAARTYFERRNNNCTIEGNTNNQAYRPNPNEAITKAVNDTRGLVMVSNSVLVSAEYDGFCIESEDETNYYAVQPSGAPKSERALPKDWASANGFPSLYAQKNSEGKCRGGHGRGMSQWGSYYLAREKGYTYDRLLKFYYGENVALHSIYIYSASDNYTITTSDGLEGQLTEPLSSFLTSKGSSVAAFNDQMLRAVLEAGPGTRDAVVAVIGSSIGTLYNTYQVRIPYTLSGQHGFSTIFNASRELVNRPGNSFFGIDPNWGTPARRADGSAFYYHYGYDNRTYYFHGYGPDCSGFVTWVLYNAGFHSPLAGAGTQGNYGPKYRVNSSYRGKPGDLMWHEGHIMIIIGVNEEKQIYTVAHASGRTDGVKINNISFINPQNYIVDMSGYYSENIAITGQIEYSAAFNSGRLG